MAGPFDRWPTGMGFEYFYGFIGGETHQYYPVLFENTRAVEPTTTPEQGYHFMTDMTDRAINYIQYSKSVAPQKPFFLYVAPGAAHAPHHAPQEWSHKFEGQFDQGWEMVREETFARQLKSGPDGTLNEVKALNGFSTPLEDNLKRLDAIGGPDRWMGSRSSPRSTVRMPSRCADGNTSRFSVTARSTTTAGSPARSTHSRGVRTTRRGIGTRTRGSSGGYALYVQEGGLVYHFNWFDETRTVITSSEPVPAGKSTVRFDFAYDGGDLGSGGTGSLFINDKKVGQTRIKKTGPGRFGIDTFGVGMDTGSPVSNTYKPPFAFTGTIQEVHIELK